MTNPIPDLSTTTMNPSPTPWWAWFVLSAMTAGAILAAVVFSRQGGHIAANAQTAHQVEAISQEVRAVKGDVYYLRAFVDQVQANSEAKSAANARRIDEVEVKAADRADAGDARDDASDDRQDARDIRDDAP